ncbi:MAG: hypothetical protein UH080_05700 [Ruminococcus sp.]|nr:hypothetical protein [Ruminococcus sp.]
MELLIEILDFILDLFGESVANFFDRRIKSRKIKAFLSLLSIIIGIALIIGIIVVVILIANN